MKTMRCKQLWGACDLEFQANTFEEIAHLSKEHWQEMFIKGDIAHLKAMEDMKEVMKTPDLMIAWVSNKKKEFEDLPND